MFKQLVAGLVMAAVVVTSASAMTVKEFKKLTTEQQSIYIGAAINMVVYVYATEGNSARARCVRDWYYSDDPRKETPGPRAVRVEIAVAEERGPEKFHIEGLILGLTDQVCAPSKPAAVPPR